jgi:flagellar L-ring protein precursor FlgH
MEIDMDCAWNRGATERRSDEATKGEGSGFGVRGSVEEGWLANDEARSQKSERMTNDEARMRASHSALSTQHSGLDAWEGSGFGVQGSVAKAQLTNGPLTQQRTTDHGPLTLLSTQHSALRTQHSLLPQSKIENRKSKIPLAAVIVLATVSSLWAQTPAVGQATQHGTDPERRSVGDLVQRNGGSLLRASLSAAPEPSRARLAQVSFIHVPEPEPRTLKKHDLVTIIIREESQFRSQGTTDLSRETEIQAALREWLRFNTNGYLLQGGGQGPVPPSVRFNSSREFQGEGSVDRSDRLIARIQAEVVDVKPNGTFAIQARKRIQTDEEEQELILTGICRGADVTVDNTILSTQIANLELIKSHKGAVRDSTRRGLVPRLLDFVNPF